MLGIYENLPRNCIEKRRHIAATMSALAQPESKNTLDHFYGTLSIIDNKASALLTHNSVIIAIYALCIKDSQNYFLIIGVFMTLIASVLLLSITWVHWSKTEELEDTELQLATLQDVRIERTIRCRAAWWLSGISVFVIVISLSIEYFLIDYF